VTSSQIRSGRTAEQHADDRFDHVVTDFAGPLPDEETMRVVDQLEPELGPNDDDWPGLPMAYVSSLRVSILAVLEPRASTANALARFEVGTPELPHAASGSVTGESCQWPTGPSTSSPGV
jgi:hypothetical protein